MGRLELLQWPARDSAGASGRVIAHHRLPPVPAAGREPATDRALKLDSPASRSNSSRSRGNSVAGMTI